MAALAGCRSPYEGGGELRARRVALEREVEGLRQAVATRARGESLLPPEDVAVGVEDALLRDLIVAQLPFEIETGGFHVVLTDAEVVFRGSPLVSLRGSGAPTEHPELNAAVTVAGALEDVRVEPSTGTLRARIAVDHIGIEKVAGLEALLSGATLDELARSLRLQLVDTLPEIQIPVRVQPAVELPALDSGPVRIAAAKLPLEVGVSRVFAGQGRLWVAVSIRPGAIVRTTTAASQAPGATR
jgi:hypothetical protein